MDSPALEVFRGHDLLAKQLVGRRMEYERKRREEDRVAAAFAAQRRRRLSEVSPLVPNSQPPHVRSGEPTKEVIGRE